MRNKERGREDKEEGSLKIQHVKQEEGPGCSLKPSLFCCFTLSLYLPPLLKWQQTPPTSGGLPHFFFCCCVEIARQDLSVLVTRGQQTHLALPQSIHLRNLTRTPPGLS